MLPPDLFPLAAMTKICKVDITCIQVVPGYGQMLRVMRQRERERDSRIQQTTILVHMLSTLRHTVYAGNTEKILV